MFFPLSNKNYYLLASHLKKGKHKLISKHHIVLHLYLRHPKKARKPLAIFGKIEFYDKT